jgi:hypothetical protein
MTALPNVDRLAALKEGVADASSSIYECFLLSRLIELAGDTISETCYDDRDDSLKAFGLGSSISATSNILIAKLESAMFLVDSLTSALEVIDAEIGALAAHEELAK